MKILRQYLPIFIITFFIVFLYKSQCSNTKINNQEIKIVSPKIEKTFKTVEPILTKIDTSKIKNSIDKIKIKKIDSVNKQKINFFNIQNDSIKTQIYTNEIEPKLFNEIFDDENITITFNGLASGKIYSLNTNYTIKEKTTIINSPKNKLFAVKIGAEYGNNILLKNSVFKANLEIENKNGNSISYSYDTNNTHWIGCKFTILQIKN